jgi:hypothetical protein
MGCHDNIRIDTFPKQASMLGKHVRVCFHYDSSKIIEGTVVRDDAEEPFKMIIKLDNNRYVLSTECQWSPKD